MKVPAVEAAVGGDMAVVIAVVFMGIVFIAEFAGLFILVCILVMLAILAMLAMLAMLAIPAATPMKLGRLCCGFMQALC